MGFFRKKNDPIAEHARALNERLARLQSEIDALSHRLEDGHPRVRSTALPGRAPAAPARVAPREPVFEDVDHQRVTAPPEVESTPAHFNHLGARKYDLLALLRRWRDALRGPAASSPRLVNYLVAGSIHGLRPLRYERRVARNRFLAFFGILLLALWGILIMWLRNR